MPPIESTRIYLHLADDWLASQYRHAAEVIDVQVYAVGSPPLRTSVAELQVSIPAAMTTTLPARFSLDQPGRGGGAPMASWEQIVVDLPLVAATMRTYLDQVAVVLRPGSVTNTDQCLRSFATYLLLHHHEISRVRDIGRAHVEGFKLWLAARPGRSGTPRATNATLAYRLGTLRMFFLRIDEWG